MATEIIMPKFGLSMEEGTIGAWLVKEGDKVTDGQPIAEVNSEKLTNNANATCDGVVAKLLLDEGDTLPCGEAIAIIVAEGESYNAAAAAAPQPTPAAAAPAPAASAPAAPPPVVAAAPVALAAPAPTGDVKITPRAKKIAEAQGLSYAHIRGTGLHGFITIEDLKREGRPLGSAAPVAAAAPVAPAPAAYAPAPAAPAPVQYAPAMAGAEVLAMSPMQSAISKGMYQSMVNAAQTTLATEANVRNLTAVYKSLKGKYTEAGIKLSYTAMLIKAVAMALENHKEVRMRLVDDAHYTVMESIDIGVAVDVPGGLIVPMVRSANLKDLRTICLDLADITARAKNRALNESDLGGGCMTVTNLGMFGVTYFTPILNEPEPIILGVGSIVEKPVARDGGIFVDGTMNLSLTHDHRVINGAPAARFLQEVVQNLGNFQWV